MVFSKEEKDLILQQLKGRSSNAFYQLKYDYEGIVVGIVSVMSNQDNKVQAELRSGGIYTGKQLQIACSNRYSNKGSDKS